MKETYTSAEARAALHVDAKTFLRWLEQADMQPQISRADHRVKLFTHEQVQRLADEHERDLQAGEDTLSTDERLAALESRLLVVEGLLAEMSSNNPIRRLAPPRATYAALEASESITLPDGYTPIVDLIHQHGAPETTVMRNMRPWLKTGPWHTSDGRVVRYALDAEGVAEFKRRYER